METYKQLRHGIIEQLQGRLLTDFVQLWLILFSQKHSEHRIWDTISEYSVADPRPTPYLSQDIFLHPSSFIPDLVVSCLLKSTSMYISVRKIL